MSGLTQLGMTDMATRPRSGVWKFGVLLLLLVAVYIGIRNYLFIRAGMLRPDFGLIHQAYDFNLWELPLTLFVIAWVIAGLALTWRAKRRGLIGLAALFVFLSVDLWLLRYYVTTVEPTRLEVRHVVIETPKLTAPLRILHISDIQAGAITEYERAMFDQIQALEPDLILNTGDFLQAVPPATFESEFPKLMALIQEVNPRFGTYGVFGDTERELYSVSPQAMAPLVILSSRTETIDTGQGLLSVHGLSLYNSQNPDWAERTVEGWLDESDPNAFRILFGHSPNFALGVERLPIDLCLAGHTHGGQVRVPGYGPLVIDSEVPRDWARGFRRVGIPYLNVSAGAGSNRFGGLPPIRFNCPTEMTLIELVPMRPIR